VSPYLLRNFLLNILLWINYGIRARQPGMQV
jgi:hypothetical protein